MVDLAELKKSPDYSDGYWDAVDGLPARESASEAYTVGYDNAVRSVALLRGAGFKQTGRATFSKTTVLKAPRP